MLKRWQQAYENTPHSLSDFVRLPLPDTGQSVLAVTLKYPDGAELTFSESPVIDMMAALIHSAAPSVVLFVFINRSKTIVRILSYDGTGFWLLTKRLSKGKFTGWPKEGSPLSAMTAKHLHRLLQISSDQINNSTWKKSV